MKTLVSVVNILLISVCSFAQIKTNSFKLNDSKNQLSNISSFNFIKNSDLTAKKKRDFTCSINMYLWATSLNGTTALPVDNPLLNITQTPDVTINLKFSDAVSHLKMAAMLAGNFMYKNVGIVYDVAYVKLGFDGTVSAESHYLSAAVTAKQFNGDFSLAYKFPVKNKQLNILGYAGSRVFIIDNTIDLVKSDNSTETVNKSKTIIDLIVGAGFRVDASKRIFTFLKADVGGFGISSKFTGSVMLTGGYKFSENWNTTLGFKYLYTDYEKDNYLWKMSQYGLLLSIGYMLN